jgi:hypothetical protein
MRVYPAAVAAHLAARKAMLVHVLMWITAKDRSTGAAASIGLWTGDDHQTITVGGAARTYYGAGAMLGLEPLVQRAGLEVRQHKVTVSPLSAEVVTALRTYEPRLAPVELHEWHFDPVTMTALDVPQRVFKGNLISAPITTPPEGGDATAELTLVSAAWALTRGLTLKRSDSALRARAASDAFRQYGDISGAVETAWGEKIAAAPSASTAPTRVVDNSDYDGYA